MTEYDTALAEWLHAHPAAATARSVERPKRTRVNYTKRAAERIAAGLHPVMYPMRLREPIGEHTCGDCAHLIARELSGRYLKCDLNDTASEATDIRRRWPACAKWAAA